MASSAGLRKELRRDHLGHHHPFGHRRNRAQSAETLQQRLVGHLQVAAMDKEMVAQADAVIAERIRRFRQRPGLGEITLRQHHIEFSLEHSCQPLAIAERMFTAHDGALADGLQINGVAPPRGRRPAMLASARWR